MSNYSYSKEINRSSVVLCEFDMSTVREIFKNLFEFYDPKVKAEIFDSFCEDFYDLAKSIPASSERIWRMIITDMLFNYDEKGYLEANTTDNSIKRKQFAIMANVIIGKLRANQ
ncbi:MAG: hypothetical protein HFG73_01010 [Hungatella sp.]|nr:hypothetical protein [Hungatella sp.]